MAVPPLAGLKLAAGLPLHRALNFTAGANLDNRVLIFYEYTGDPATTITVSKNGADIEVSW